MTPLILLKRFVCITTLACTAYGEIIISVEAETDRRYDYADNTTAPDRFTEKAYHGQAHLNPGIAFSGNASVGPGAGFPACTPMPWAGSLVGCAFQLDPEDTFAHVAASVNGQTGVIRAGVYGDWAKADVSLFDRGFQITGAPVTFTAHVDASIDLLSSDGYGSLELILVAENAFPFGENHHLPILNLMAIRSADDSENEGTVPLHGSVTLSDPLVLSLLSNATALRWRLRAFADDAHVNAMNTAYLGITGGFISGSGYNYPGFDPGSSAVPEPGSGALLAIGAAVLYRISRTRARRRCDTLKPCASSSSMTTSN
jgi:hypothetical protein